MFRKLTILLLLCAAIAAVLIGCGSVPDAEDTLSTETVPPVTTPPDGNPNDVTCLGTYSADDGNSGDAARTVVATLGDATLTNEQLQVYYWLEVAAYRMSGADPAPNFSQELDTQLVMELDSGSMTWQQFFLKRALDTWATHQALVLMSQTEGVPTEEAYQPDMEKRTEYMTGKPATKYLYGWNESYVPNRLHQAYLEEIPSRLTELADQGSFGAVSSMAAELTGTDEEPLLYYADLANRAYMYFTEMSYHFEPTAEEITAYYEAHQADIPSSGEKTVSIRHILLIPENSEIAADGTVTASEDAWKRGLTQANDLISKWQKKISRTRYSKYAQASVPESRFSEFACDYSDDAGSRANGGLYTHLRQGQLLPELDSWCFDPARQRGDYEIIRSGCGWHIVYFCGAQEDWYDAAEAAMRTQYDTDLVSHALDANPLQVTYEVIRLPRLAGNGGFTTLEDLLYPDVAHERFPDMPLYLQQDYPTAPYGDYLLRTHGCGITTLAMVASYLADEELTPVELAARYGYYCGPNGTEQVLFDDTPAELGFHLVKRSYSWEEVKEAIREGYVVVSLQWAGYWTSGGHYLAIIGETDDGEYVVRDSNLLNYKRIPAHVNDCHTGNNINAACHGYWIYDYKVTRIPACTRCGNTGDAAAPEILFQSDYCCEKCRSALSRRNAFLALSSDSFAD